MKFVIDVLAVALSLAILEMLGRAIILFFHHKDDAPGSLATSIAVLAIAIIFVLIRDYRDRL